MTNNFGLLCSNASDNSKYLTFDVIDQKSKTVVVSVMSKSSGDILGYIKWFPNWRQYTLLPESETVFNYGCLKEIENVLVLMNNLQKQNRVIV